MVDKVEGCLMQRVANTMVVTQRLSVVGRRLYRDTKVAATCNNCCAGKSANAVQGRRGTPAASIGIAAKPTLPNSFNMLL